MISKFRKGADNLFVRILLALIALSFVGIGGASFLKDNAGNKVVIFSNTDSISYEDFRIAKAREIDLLQKQSGITLTPEEIEQKGIDHFVLSKLVANSMINYLAKIYEFDVTEEKVISYVKASPFFKNSNDEFDPNLFKSAFNNSLQREESYIKSVKDEILKSCMLGTFMNSFYVPEIMVKNPVNYISQSRTVDIISFDLTFKPNAYQAPSFTQDQLKSFYNQNKDDFAMPEQRSFDYLKIDKEFLQKKLKFTDKDLKNYFEQHSGAFEAKSFDKAKIKVQQAFVKEKIDELITDIAKNLEENLAQNLTLQEIADKYNLVVNKADYISFAKMKSGIKVDYSEIADTVFEMDEQEISYPLEIQDKSEIFLVQLNSINPAKIQEFSEVEDDIINLLKQKFLAAENLKNIEKFKSDFSTKKVDKKLINSLGGEIVVNQVIARINTEHEKNLPLKLLESLFNTEKNQVTDIVLSDNKAYFAYIKDINMDKEKSAKFKKDYEAYFTTLIKDGVIQELINYLAKQNNMQIKLTNE